MPIVRQDDFGTERAPEWCKIEGGIVAMGCSTREVGATVEMHFHDAEEYWFVQAGKAKVVTEGEEHIVGPGDIVCTHMDVDHAILEIVEAPYTQIWVQCALRGEKRQGHLHRDQD